MSDFAALLDRLPPAAALVTLKQRLAAARRQREQQRSLFRYFPDDGPLRRELYPRHMEFFAAGGTHEPGSLPACGPDCDGSSHRERLMLAANRVGKTESVGAYEVALHATGRYPDWWPGRRFLRPVDIWAAGKKTRRRATSSKKNCSGRPLCGAASNRLTAQAWCPAKTSAP